MMRTAAVLMAGVIGAFAIVVGAAAYGGGESLAVSSPALSPSPSRTGENVVVSPVSLNAVLAMTLNGARGDPAAQMRKALRLEALEPQAANQAWAGLIAASNATKRAEVRIADSLWLRNGVEYVPSFLAADRDHFAADTRNLPDDLAEAPEEINAWIAERTGDRIKDLVAELPPETALVLVNTVYAKVGWEFFHKAQTKLEPFTLADGTEVQVPTMRGVTTAEIATTAEYDAVPAETNGELTFWVVVPKGAQTPESVAALLRERGIGSLSKHTTYAAVDLRLPRFRIEYACQDLKGDLAAMGMPDVFSPAAGSAVMMCGSAGPEKKMAVRADRPFLAVLTGSYTDVPLFMALMRDPR